MNTKIANMTLSHNIEIKQMERRHLEQKKAVEREAWRHTSMHGDTMQVCVNKTIEIKDRISLWFNGFSGQVWMSFGYIDNNKLLHSRIKFDLSNKFGLAMRTFKCSRINTVVAWVRRGRNRIRYSDQLFRTLVVV